MKTAIALVLLAVCGVCQAQSIGVNITAASGKMAPFVGTHRAYLSSSGSGGQQFFAHIPQGDGQILSIAWENMTSPQPRQIIRVFLVEWRAGMNVTCSARLPLTGGTAATIGGGGSTTRAGEGIGSPDGGSITLVVTP